MSGPSEEVLRASLVRHSGAAFQVGRAISPRASATQLFHDGALAAERCIPAPLGPAIAGVLAKAAYERKLHQISGSLGAEYTMLALALAAMDVAGTPTTDGGDPNA